MTEKIVTEPEAVKSFVESVETDLKHMDELIMPLLRVYVNDVRSIRMALGSEVKDILRSTVEMRGVTKMTEDLLKFASVINLLKETLTPEVVEMLRRIAGDEKK